MDVPCTHSHRGDRPFHPFCQWKRLRLRDKATSHCIHVPGAVITKDHKLGNLKQQKRILLQSWRPDVKIAAWAGPWSPGVGPSVSLPASAGSGHPGALWLTATSLSPCRSFHVAVSPVRVHVLLLT